MSERQPHGGIAQTCREPAAAKAAARTGTRQAHAWWTRFTEVRPDLAWADVPEAHRRGVDFYSVEGLLKATQFALEIFRRTLGRDPDPTMPRTNDHFFVQKFLMPLPRLNPANKLNAAAFLPAAHRDAVRVLPKAWIGTRPELPPDDAVPPGRYMLKLALGNAANAPVSWPPSADDRVRLNTIARHWYSHRYGIDWGEWWYGVGQQRLYLEQDITEARAGHPEFKLFVRRGKVVMLRAALYQPSGGYARQACVMSPSFRKIEGTVDTYGPLEIEVPRSAPAMLRAAAAIGREVDLLRVDFMDTGEARPILNELTVGEQNARRLFLPERLEAHALGALFG